MNVDQIKLRIAGLVAGVGGLLLQSGCSRPAIDSAPAAPVCQTSVRVAIVAHNGMPRNIVPRGAEWNFGSGSLWTFNGWQYAAYWDDARQVSVARRQLPAGRWEVFSLPDYQRTESGDRGRGGAISRGFGDGHEKVAMGISADGFIHLSFDHHLSTLRYRVTRLPVASNPAAHKWAAGLFGPVRDNLGGPRLDCVTYPSFTADGSDLVLYLRMGGGSGAANSHLFTYSGGRWIINTEAGSQFIDQKWSGGDGTVNAYPQGLAIHNGRWHITWGWRDTPDERTSHDLCYAFSDDAGKTWRNNDGEVIGVRGKKFITADSPGVAVWKIPPGSGYRNGGSMIVDPTGRLHVLAYGGRTGGIQFMRDPETREWSRQDGAPFGAWVAGEGNSLYAVTGAALYRTAADRLGEWVQLAALDPAWFEDSKLVVDRSGMAHNGTIFAMGQAGKTVRVVEAGCKAPVP